MSNQISLTELAQVTGGQRTPLYQRHADKLPRSLVSFLYRNQGESTGLRQFIISRFF